MVGPCTHGPTKPLVPPEVRTWIARHPQTPRCQRARLVTQFAHSRSRPDHSLCQLTAARRVVLGATHQTRATPIDGVAGPDYATADLHRRASASCGDPAPAPECDHPGSRHEDPAGTRTESPPAPDRRRAGQLGHMDATQLGGLLLQLGRIRVWSFPLRDRPSEMGLVPLSTQRPPQGDTRHDQHDAHRPRRCDRRCLDGKPPAREQELDRDHSEQHLPPDPLCPRGVQLAT